MPPYVQQPVDTAQGYQQPESGLSSPSQGQQKPYQQPIDVQQGTLHRNGCFNIQWLLFIFGWLILIPSIVAIFLPLCSGRPRFPSKSYLAGWVANIVLSVLQIVAIIVIIVVTTKNNGGCTTDQYGYSYCY